MNEMGTLLDKALEKSIERAILVRLQALEEGDWLAVSQLLSDLHDDGALPRFDMEKEALFYGVLSLLVDRKKKVSRRTRDGDDEEVKLPSREGGSLPLAA